MSEKTLQFLTIKRMSLHLKSQIIYSLNLFKSVWNVSIITYVNTLFILE